MSESLLKLQLKIAEEKKIHECLEYLLKIEIAGKPLGRPSKDQLTREYQEKMAKNVGERN
ncbi:MAG: hypothetical protein KAZ28_00745 [Bacteroidaceae bacterium]|nr:hypothetical protein [Bacteroidaceae bacterium]